MRRALSILGTSALVAASVGIWSASESRCSGQSPGVDAQSRLPTPERESSGAKKNIHRSSAFGTLEAPAEPQLVTQLDVSSQLSAYQNEHIKTSMNVLQKLAVSAAARGDDELRARLKQERDRLLLAASGLPQGVDLNEERSDHE